MPEKHEPGGLLVIPKARTYLHGNRPHCHPYPPLTFVALALLIARSDPKQKGLVILLIRNLIA